MVFPSRTNKTELIKMEGTYNSYWLPLPSCIRTTACTPLEQYRRGRKQEAPNHRLHRNFLRHKQRCTDAALHSHRHSVSHPPANQVTTEQQRYDAFKCEWGDVWKLLLQKTGCVLGWNEQRVDRGRVLPSILCLRSWQGLSCSPGVLPASSSRPPLSTEPPVIS